MNVLVTGRGGLGDAVYARPFVRTIARHLPVQVSTSWPWVFSDMPVGCVKRVGGLQTQAYHGDLVPAEAWAQPRQYVSEVSLRYRWPQLARSVSILAEMEVASGVKPESLVLDLPPLPASPLTGAYAVVRPPAIRVDFPAPAREPLPEYLAIASRLLSGMGFQVATVGAWVKGLEEPNGEPVPADVRFENAELSLPEAFALVANAAVVVSGPCWLIPACLATETPLVVIAGGCGGRNNPASLVDQRLAAASCVRWLLPDRYCATCTLRAHNCPKVIPNFEQRFSAEVEHAVQERYAA